MKKQTWKNLNLNEVLYALQSDLKKNTRYEIRDRSFPKQDQFVMDRSKFVSAQCSRRAGKSNGLAIRFMRSMEKHPKAFYPYIALTRESARNIMWPVLQEMNDKFQMGCEFIESKLTMVHPNGSRLQLFGADMQNFIRRLKGIKTPGAAIDEAQDFGPHIQSLVEDVLTPTLTDYQDSWLAITGTPGPVPVGYFYELTAEKKYGFSHHEWTLYDNPYLPLAREFVTELKIKRGWDEDNPTLKREWYNQWVTDKKSLLIHYNPEVNHYETLPLFKSKWVYILGIDLGYQDKDALAVLAWNEETDVLYLIHEELTAGDDISALVSKIQRLSSLYDFSKMVIDTGGLGKKIAEEIIKRHHIPVQAADKTRKMENIEFLNDYLRRGKFKASRVSHFATDSYKVQIDWTRTTPDRIVVRDDYHSDIIDAVLYAFKESPAYTYQAPVAGPQFQTPEWYQNQVNEMEKQAEDYFSRLERNELE